MESEAWDVGVICFSNLSWAPECKPLIFDTNNNDSNNQIKKGKKKKKKRGGGGEQREKNMKKRERYRKLRNKHRNK